MLSTLDYLNIGLTIAVVVTYGYVTYSALVIRRTLAAGLYRRHALGVGLLAVAFTGAQLGMFLPYNGITGILGGVIFYTFALVVLYWVDTSILAARGSDPLYRDTFAWSRLRYVAWGTAIATIAIVFGVTAYYLPINGASIPPSFLGLLLSVLFPLPIYVAAISGVVIIPVAARRSGDLVFRKHLRWFFLFLAIQLVLQGGAGQFLDPLSASVVDAVALLLGLYPIYQSAKRLVPLYRFSADEAQIVVGPNGGVSLPASA